VVPLVFTAKGGVQGQGEEDLVGMVDGGKKSQRKWGFGGDRPETS